VPLSPATGSSYCAAPQLDPVIRSARFSCNYSTMVKTALSIREVFVQLQHNGKNCALTKITLVTVGVNSEGPPGNGGRTGDAG